MRKAFGVTLYCRAQKVRKKDGKAPVEVTITVNGQKSSFQLLQAYDPAEFARLRDSKKVNEVRTLCGKIIADISELHVRRPFLDAVQLKERYLNGDPEAKLLGEKVYVYQVCKAYLATVVKGLPSYRKYEKAFERFRRGYGYHLIDEVGPADIKRYVLRLKNVDGFAEGTCRNETKKIRSLFNYAFEKGIIRSNPFAGLRFTFKDPDPVFLTAEELDKIRKADLKLGHLQKARKIFLFLCGCGALEYSDYANLKFSDVKEKDGMLVVSGNRVKTGQPYFCVLAGDAPEIWKEWKEAGEIPVISCQKLNKYIKDVVKEAGITDKRVVLLTARHTFATLALSGELGNGRKIPIEVLRRCLGHVGVSQSLHYARLIDDAVIESFK